MSCQQEHSKGRGIVGPMRKVPWSIATSSCTPSISTRWCPGGCTRWDRFSAVSLRREGRTGVQNPFTRALSPSTAPSLGPSPRFPLAWTNLSMATVCASATHPTCVLLNPPHLPSCGPTSRPSPPALTRRRGSRRRRRNGKERSGSQRSGVQRRCYTVPDCIASPCTLPGHLG